MTQNQKSYEKAEIKKLGNSEVEISGSVAIETWKKYRERALKNINNSISVDGFRKGMVPENILTAKVGAMAILEEIAEIALSKAYMEILVDQKIDAIGQPLINIAKLADENPIEFKIKTAVVPEITLPDYKILAQKEVKAASSEDLEVTEKDIDEAILRIRKSRVSHEGHDHKKMTPEEHDKAVMESLPEVNDEFVKSLGKFENVDGFKNKIKMVGEEKKDAAKEKLRMKIAESVLASTKLDLPDVMIESELNRTMAQFETDIERMGVKLEDYMKHAKKTVEDLRNEWKPQAEKKAKLQLILNEIAKAEKLSPDQKEIENEVSHILNHYKDADRERATVYAETVLTNEKVFQFLEGQK